jgi:hypothetical protein
MIIDVSEGLNLVQSLAPSRGRQPQELRQMLVNTQRTRQASNLERSVAQKEWVTVQKA